MTQRSSQVAWRLLQADRAAYFNAWSGWIIFWSFPIVSGLALKGVLDHVAPHAPGTSVWVLLAVLAGAELGRWAWLLWCAYQFHGAWVGWHTVPRVNVFRSLAVDPGPSAGRLPSSSGDAVSRFRDDCMDLAMVLDVWLDVSGAVVSSAIGFVIMATIDLWATLVVALPIIVVLGLARWFAPKLREWRRHAREATAEVTSFIGDSFGAITAVKAAGAEEAVHERFVALGHRRAALSRLDQVGSQIYLRLAGTTANVGVGLALIAIAPRIRSGAFTVGDLGLFTTYILVLAQFPRWMGRMAAHLRQAEVSVERLADLTASKAPLDYVAATPTFLRHGPGPYVPPIPTPRADRRGRDRLEVLEARGLTVTFPTGGIAAVDLTLERGSFTVVTGPVGSGKSTLLRALLGLVPVDGGRVLWNGEVVEDPSAFLVPPRAAYLPQVPRLFSEPLVDTILLGLADDGLAEALRLACLDEDLDDFPDGLATLVGPKGVRLSGGQIQRSAAARAFVRQPELLVVDDLSSALDVDTEAQVWARLLAATRGSSTALVVTHRESVIAQADQVITLG